MTTPDRLTRLLEKSRSYYDQGESFDPGHDSIHIDRVMANCRAIAPTVGADLEIVLPAAILHDVINVPKNSPDRLEASRMAADKARGILAEFGYAETEIAHIAQVILEHSYSRGMKPSSIESAVLQDADKLDALGAVGIMRTVSCGVKMRAVYYDPNEPFVEGREYDDRRYTIDHFFVKLFKLPALMNTEWAKKEAERRIQFMTAFLNQLKREVEPHN